EPRICLRSQRAGLLWIALAIAGCSGSTPPPTDGSTSPTVAGGVSATPEAPTAPGTASAGTAAASGAPASVQPAGQAAGAAGVVPTAGGRAEIAGAPAQAAGAASPAAVGGSGAPSAGAGAGAGAGGMTVSAGAGGGAAGATGATFPPASDLAGDGPYTAMTVMSTGPGGTYTIYRPSELAPGGAKHPIVGWMSGGGSTPSQYELLPHLATHGFIVVASNTSPAVGAESELGQEILAGIEWVIAENAKAGSEYFDKVDATKLASMGYSMGALATTTIGGDPRLTTTVHISGGNMETARVKVLHAPAAFLCGASGNDIAGANCATDFEATTAPVFYGVFNGGDHLGVRTDPYAERIREVVTGWLRWHLMSDASLKPMFVGSDCAVCKDTHWTVMQKNLM
ncbi:MAG: hypothetical protein ABW321_23895, partial [Polyangiales bacterium]